jgi:uncharacterized Rmd1/YagE family protein
MRVLLAFRRWSAVRHGCAPAAASMAAWPMQQQQQQQRGFSVAAGVGRGGSTAAATSPSSLARPPRPWHHHHLNQQQQHCFSSSEAAPDDPQQQQPKQPQQQRPDRAADALEATLVSPPQHHQPPRPRYYANRHTAEAVVVLDEDEDEDDDDDHQDQHSNRRTTSAAPAPALRRAPPPPARPAAADDGDHLPDESDSSSPQRHHPQASAAAAARLHVRAYHVGGEVDVPAFCAAEGPWSLRLLARDHAILRATADADPTEETDLLLGSQSEGGAGDASRRGGGAAGGARRSQEEGGGSGEEAEAAAAAGRPSPAAAAAAREKSDERLFVVYRFGSVIFFGSDEAADDRWIRRIRAYTQDPSPEPVSDETTLVVVGAAASGAGSGGGGGGGGGHLQQQPAAAYPYHGADVFSAAMDGGLDGDDHDHHDPHHHSPSPLLPRGAWFALQPDRVVLRRLDVGNARVISSVLGQSVALEHYHRRVDRAIEALAPILHEIAATGRSRSVASSDRKLLRLIGENSLLYTQVVAKLGLLDTSDAAWGKDRYHSVWRALRADYELDRRFDALNRKLGPMLENAKFVLEVREDKKSERSELIIIALIGTEILLHVAQHFVPAVLGAVVV